jgi:hypothetical protein
MLLWPSFCCVLQNFEIELLVLKMLKRYRDENYSTRVKWGL